MYVGRSAGKSLGVCEGFACACEFTTSANRFYVRGRASLLRCDCTFMFMLMVLLLLLLLLCVVAVAVVVVFVC